MHTRRRNAIERLDRRASSPSIARILLNFSERNEFHRQPAVFRQQLPTLDRASIGMAGFGQNHSVARTASPRGTECSYHLPTPWHQRPRIRHVSLR